MKTVRKRFERVPFFAGLELTLLPSGRSVPSRSFDISRGGVGLVCPVAPEPNQIVRLAFDLPGRGGVRVTEAVMGRVVYTRSDVDGTIVGVEFLGLLDERSNPVLFARMMGE